MKSRARTRRANRGIARQVRRDRRYAAHRHGGAYHCRRAWRNGPAYYPSPGGAGGGAGRACGYRRSQQKHASRDRGGHDVGRRAHRERREKAQPGCRRQWRRLGVMASDERCHYIDAAGLRGAKESNPRGLTILTGAVPAGPLGSDTWRPPTYVGSRDQRSYGQRGSALDCCYGLNSRHRGYQGGAAPRGERATRRVAGGNAQRRRRDDRGPAVSAAVTAGAIVSGFMPLKNEINPLPLLRKLSERGARSGAACRGGARPAARHARVEVGRTARFGCLGHSRARARSRDSGARYLACSVAGLRSPGRPAGLWRRLLRFDSHATARAQDRCRAWASHSLSRRYQRCPPLHATRRSILC